MRGRFLCGVLTGLVLMAQGGRAGSPELALALGREGQHRLAALEYRRLALATNEALAAGRWPWLAAHEYAQEKAWDLSGPMLDRAEDHAPDDLAGPVAWLRAEQALAERDWATAAFYFESLHGAAGREDPLWRDFAARGAAAACLRAGRLDAARAAAPDEARAAIDGYAARRDKKPWLGGCLGLVPGLGYLYAGETGNAIRSLLLNGIFLWGMVETAEEDLWGPFAVLAFAEFTWYSGSIYGGLDAVHRQNAGRLDAAVEAVRGERRPRVRTDTIPLFSLGFEF